jgi:cyclopropane fatty-acyl-phospholipid synthase-like methyltransferase
MSEHDEAFWDERYRSAHHAGHRPPSPHLVAEAARLAPGRALDVGAGEGADAICLAEHGWEVTAVDLSAIALDRARRRAEERGVAERITWRHADITAWVRPAGTFDLVTSHYLHVAPDKWSAAFAAIAAAVAPGGTLLFAGHHPDDDTAGFGHVTADQLAAGLGDGWTIVAADTRGRDAVLVARRAISGTPRSA